MNLKDRMRMGEKTGKANSIFLLPLLTAVPLSQLQLSRSGPPLSESGFNALPGVLGIP